MNRNSGWSFVFWCRFAVALFLRDKVRSRRSSQRNKTLLGWFLIIRWWKMFVAFTFRKLIERLFFDASRTDIRLPIVGWVSFWRRCCPQIYSRAMNARYSAGCSGCDSCYLPAAITRIRKPGKNAFSKDRFCSTHRDKFLSRVFALDCFLCFYTPKTMYSSRTSFLLFLFQAFARRLFLFSWSSFGDWRLFLPVSP